ncbi:MAG: hypothetical protein LBU73_02855 [Helicobacteraceae bacterium]|jgi:hypothetical protein|nr:hypothetical protein [Helicobacteraceae bacterium]
MRKITIAAFVFLAALAVSLAVYFETVRSVENLRFSLEKREFLPAEPIKITLSNTPKSSDNTRFVIGVWVKSLEKTLLAEARRFKYMNQREIVLSAPRKAGHYELRAAEKRTGEMEVFAREELSVVKAENAFKMAIDKENYSPDDKIKLKISGVPIAIIDNEPFAAIYETDALLENPKSKKTLSTQCVSQCEIVFDAPDSNGEYEVRSYVSSLLTHPDMQVAALKFKVKKR